MQEFDTSVEVAISNIASDGIRDFYSVHVMAYCEGYFEPSAAISLQNPIPKRNVTGCSNRTALFNFHPSEALSRDLEPGANLSDLNWSNAIDDDFKVLDVTSKTMAVLYIIGTAATGVAVLAGGWLIFSGGRLEAIAEVVFTIVCFSSPCTYGRFFALEVIATKCLRIHRSGLLHLAFRLRSQQLWLSSLSTLSTDMAKILVCRPRVGRNS